jgi:hypothetical protein
MTSTMTQPQMSPPPVPRSWWSRNWKWFVPLVTLPPLLCCCVTPVLIFMGVFSAIKASDPYVNSLQMVQTSPQVQAELGTPITPGFMMQGNIHSDLSSGGGDAEIYYPVSGPDGSATVDVKATRTAGQWTFDVVTVTIDDTGETIDLLDTAAP